MSLAGVGCVILGADGRSGIVGVRGFFKVEDEITRRTFHSIQPVEGIERVSQLIDVGHGVDVRITRGERLVERHRRQGRGLRGSFDIVLIEAQVGDAVSRAEVGGITGIGAVEQSWVLHLDMVRDEVAVGVVAIPLVIHIVVGFRLIRDGVSISIDEVAAVGSRVEGSLHIAVEESHLFGRPDEAAVVVCIGGIGVDLIRDGVEVGVIQSRSIIFERGPSARLAVAGEGATCPLLELTVRRWIDKPVIETVWHVVVIVIRAAARIPAWAKAHKDVIDRELAAAPVEAVVCAVARIGIGKVGQAIAIGVYEVSGVILTGKGHRLAVDDESATRPVGWNNGAVVRIGWERIKIVRDGVAVLIPGIGVVPLTGQRFRLTGDGEGTAGPPSAVVRGRWSAKSVKSHF